MPAFQAQVLDVGADGLIYPPVQGKKGNQGMLLAACLSARRTMINGGAPCAATAVTERAGLASHLGAEPRRSGDIRVIMSSCPHIFFEKLSDDHPYIWRYTAEG